MRGWMGSGHRFWMSVFFWAVSLSSSLNWMRVDVVAVEAVTRLALERSISEGKQWTLDVHPDRRSSFLCCLFVSVQAHSAQQLTRSSHLTTYHDYTQWSGRSPRWAVRALAPSSLFSPGAAETDQTVDTKALTSADSGARWQTVDVQYSLRPPTRILDHLKARKSELSLFPTAGFPICPP